MTAALTSVTIASPVEIVWSVLTDFPMAPRWNPFMRSIEGDLVVGARLSVMSMPPGQSPRTFEPEIITVEAPHLLAWRGGHGLPGLFDSEAVFRLTAVDEHTTLYTQSERYYGLLTPLLMRGARKAALHAGYEKMSAALKAKAEAVARDADRTPDASTG